MTLLQLLPSFGQRSEKSMRQIQVTNSKNSREGFKIFLGSQSTLLVGGSYLSRESLYIHHH